MSLFGEIAAQWQAWKNGIPPTKKWKGRDGMNPRLLRAFVTLDKAEYRATKERSETRARETPEAFMARIKSEVPH